MPNHIISLSAALLYLAAAALQLISCRRMISETGSVARKPVPNKAMAVALLTTLYGAIIANAFALPIADKLAHRSQEERLNKGLILETISSIQEGLNPRVMEELLKTYLPTSQRDAVGEAQADAA